MNRYLGENNAEAAANSRADVYLNKNLGAHYQEVSEAVVKFADAVKLGRRNNEAVSSRQQFVVEGIMFLNEIKFKMQTFEGRLPKKSEPLAIISDMEYQLIDLNNRVNFDYHLATLNYDIENVKTEIEYTPHTCGELESALHSMLDSLEKCRSSMEAFYRVIKGRA